MNVSACSSPPPSCHTLLSPFYDSSLAPATSLSATLFQPLGTHTHPHDHKLQKFCCSHKKILYCTSRVVVSMCECVCECVSLRVCGCINRRNKYLYTISELHIFRLSSANHIKWNFPFPLPDWVDWRCLVPERVTSKCCTASTSC